MSFSWNLPCIWAIMSSLSKVSCPASSSSLTHLDCRKRPDRPLNQPSQNPAVFIKSHRHTHRSSRCTSCEGTDILAESRFSNVLELTAHSTASWGEANDDGILSTTPRMCGSASSAVPSTTSTTTSPLRLGTRPEAAVRTAIAPPMLWPTRTMSGPFWGGSLMGRGLGGSAGAGSLSHTSSNTFCMRASASCTSRSALKSSSSAHTVLPCPRQSYAISRTLSRTLSATKLQLSDEWPPPCRQKTRGPRVPVR
mmetsp:Transcript_49651/g.124540  ORF Transcript_49651/g.124540 Transcript_49651/m.124540 type:complete len:252 (-) Transcript_49651:292-1047(-)